MKSILLTTTALVAFAGVAAADGHTSITHSLSATLGYNDTVNANDDNEIGFYWEGNLTTSASATLDNGLTAGAQFEITVAEDDGNTSTDDTDPTNSEANDGGLSLSSSDFVLSLEAENGAIFFGDTGRAAEKYWAAAGDMESDGVSTGSDSAVLRGDVTVGMVSASVSYQINDAFNDSDDDADPLTDEDLEALQQLSFGAEADFGVVSMTAAYQEETDFDDGNGDFNQDEVFGISASGTFSGATVTVAFAENATDETTSTGIQVAYVFSPVTVTGYFVAEEGTDLPDEDPNFGITVDYTSGPVSVAVDFDDDQGTTKTGIDGSYDVGNGLTMVAGYYTQDNEDGSDYADEYYVGGAYDLGGGASLTVSYAEGEDNGDDEIGAGDWQEGLTVELSMAF